MYLWVFPEVISSKTFKMKRGSEFVGETDLQEPQAQTSGDRHGALTG